MMATTSHMSKKKNNGIVWITTQYILFINQSQNKHVYSSIGDLKKVLIESKITKIYLFLIGVIKKSILFSIGIIYKFFKYNEKVLHMYSKPQNIVFLEIAYP